MEGDDEMLVQRFRSFYILVRAANRWNGLWRDAPSPVAKASMHGSMARHDVPAE